VKEEYDIVVVGGGPAGSTAARFAAQGGASVALFEKDREIGIPVRCAEAAGLDHLSEFIPLDSQWIAQEFDRIKLVSPAGKEVKMLSPAKGAILHRRLFDHALALEAAKAGVRIHTKSYVHKVEFQADGPQTLYVKQFGEDKKVRAGMVIAADGVESRIARFAGIRTQTALKDIESCAQMLVSNIDVEASQIEFYFSERWAPGGYAWVFPKGENSANIGLGVNGAKAGPTSAMDYLKEFLAEFYPNAVALTTVAGGVPVSKCLSTLATDGLLIVGDAARQVNPVTGGGIAASLTSGRLAGIVASKAFEKRDYSAASLKEYENVWNRSHGKDYVRMYRVKEWITKLTDKDLDDLAANLQGIPAEKLTLLKLFKTAIRNKPSLLLDVIKLFAQFS